MAVNANVLIKNDLYMPISITGSSGYFLRVKVGEDGYELYDPSDFTTLIGLDNVDNTSDANKPISSAMQDALDLKADINSPDLTGVPTAPTASFGTNTTQIATTEFVLANTVEMITDVVGLDIRNTDVNEITISSGSCKDNTGVYKMVLASDQVLALPSTSGTFFHLALTVDKITSAVSVRYYTTFADVAADVGVNITYYRIIDFWHNTSGGVAKTGYTKNGIHWWGKASENAVNSKVLLPPNCSTAVNLSAFLPDSSLVSEVLMGGQGNASFQLVVLGYDGTNAHHSFYTSVNSTGDSDAQSWSYVGGNIPQFIPIQNNTIYWGDGTSSTTGTSDLRLHAVKLRR